MERAEQYYHLKHPEVWKEYEGRYVPGRKRVVATDVRNFIFENDAAIRRTLIAKVLANKDQLKLPSDLLVDLVQQWACKKLTYLSDQKAQGYPEFWQFPNETLAMLKGDCEDGANLIKSMLNNLQIPDWRSRVVAGWVTIRGKLGGHAYVDYCRTTDNEWVHVDWCFLQDPKVPVREKPLAKDVEEYGNVWFSYNKKHAYAHDATRLGGRVRDIRV